MRLLELPQSMHNPTFNPSGKESLMTTHAVTDWTPQAAGHELTAQLAAHFHPGQGWEITGAPDALFAPVHALVWFAEQLGCELICPRLGQPAHKDTHQRAACRDDGQCHGHLPHNPQPGERIVMGTRGVGTRVVYRVTENHGRGVVLIEERAA
jgi:hypothetical protein